MASASSRPSMAQRSTANVAAPSRSNTSQSSTFFVKERERLITDIADNMEQLLGNINTLNRKLEESIVVGQEFEPIANLWGPFVDLLTNNGIQPNSSTKQTTSIVDQKHQQQMKQSQSGKELSDLANNEDPLSSSYDGPSGNHLPAGVAPGGGTIYGLSSSSSSNV